MDRLYSLPVSGSMTFLMASWAPLRVNCILPLYLMYIRSALRALMSRSRVMASSPAWNEPPSPWNVDVDASE